VSNMKDFRGIADDIMKEINVTEELKTKTLMQCMRKRHVTINKFLIPVACSVLLLGIVNMSGTLPLMTQTGDKNLEINTDIKPEVNPMIGSGDGIQPLPGQSNNNEASNSSTFTKLTFTTLDEAKKSFGDSILIPSYIPESFKLDEIYASGFDGHKATKVVLSYLAGDKSFLIIEEKIEVQNEFINFKTIDINGTTGYLKPSVSEGSENSGIPDIELHWYKEGTHYLIAGLITENEAIKIANTMN